MFPGQATTPQRCQAGPGLGQPLSSHIHPETPASGHEPPSVSDEAATMTQTAKPRILADGCQATCFPPSTAECPRRPPEAHLQGKGKGKGKGVGEGTRRRAGKVRSSEHRSRTEAPDLTGPSELLSESKQPSLSPSVGEEEEEAGGGRGSQPLQRALRSATSPCVSPLSRTVLVGETRRLTAALESAVYPTW